MSRCSGFASLTTIALMLAAFGCGQSGEVDSGSSGPQPKVSELVNLTSGPRIDQPGRVTLLVQALDRDGDPVSGLKSRDFRLFEGDEEVSPSESQQQLLAAPLVYRSLSFLLLDLSASVSRDQDTLEAEISAAKAYVRIVTEDPAHHVAIGFFFGLDEISRAIIFNEASNAFEPLGFSNDRARINEALDNVDRIEVLDDSTNLYGAVIEAADVLDDEAQALIQRDAVEFVSRALVTFTDGGHNANDLTLDAAQSALPRAGDAYTIGIGADVDPNALMALGPDGAVRASRLSKLKSSFERIGQILSDQANSYYRIGYISPKNDGSNSPVLRVEAENGDGVALLQTTFSPRFFSSGAGFVKAIANGAADVDDGACAAIEVDERDRTIVLIHDATGSGVAIGRYLESGTPDPNFGSNGRMVLPLERLRAGATLTPRDMSISPRDGRIHVVAEQTFASSTETNLVVIRFDTDGTIEFVELPANLSGDTELVDVANDIDVDSAGRVWIAGASKGASVSYRLILRLTLHLDFSSNFVNGGVLVYAVDPAMPMDEVSDLVVDRSTDRIFAVGSGYSAVRGGQDMQVVAFHDDGLLDEAFGVAGIATNPVFFEGGLIGRGHGIAAARDTAENTLIVAGSIELRTAAGRILERPAFWRFDEDGIPDPTFTGGVSNPLAPGNGYATAGAVTLGEPLVANPQVLFGATSTLESVKISDDGNIIAGGSRMNAENHEDAIWISLRPNGLLSSAYNGTGFMIEDGSIFDGGNEAIVSVSVRSDGAVASCGSTANRNSLSTSPLVFIDDSDRRQVQ